MYVILAKRRWHCHFCHFVHLAVQARMQYENILRRSGYLPPVGELACHLIYGVDLGSQNDISYRLYCLSLISFFRILCLTRNIMYQRRIR